MVLANLDKKNRLVTMFLDHVVMCIILCVVEAPAIMVHIVRLQHSRPPFELFDFGVYDVFAFSLYFCKDVFSGRSVAKRILGFQVVNHATGLPAGPVRCLVRNFTLLLWPVEVIVSMVNVNRRMGDHLAGTRLVVYDPKPAAQNEQTDWKGVLVCIPLAMAFTYVIWFLPVDLLVHLLR
ncbi:MAG TPA: RDD family protein [Puia sp.]|nr:RDD family protein [Puia sp.]